MNRASGRRLSRLIAMWVVVGALVGGLGGASYAAYSVSSPVYWRGANTNFVMQSSLNTDGHWARTQVSTYDPPTAHSADLFGARARTFWSGGALCAQTTFLGNAGGDTWVWHTMDIVNRCRGSVYSAGQGRIWNGGSNYSIYNSHATGTYAN